MKGPEENSKVIVMGKGLATVSVVLEEASEEGTHKLKLNEVKVLAM